MNEAHAIHLRRLHKEPYRVLVPVPGNTCIRNSEYEIPYILYPIYLSSYRSSVKLESVLRESMLVEALKVPGTSRSTAFNRSRTRFVLYGTPLLRIQIMLMGNLRAIYKQLHPLAY
jgi:hypothetical protein